MKQLMIIILLLTAVSCAQPPTSDHIKQRPEFSSVITDPEIKTITDEYFRLSAENNIVFNKKVSIGFSKIEKKNAIGICTFQKTFREIDLDKGFWKNSSWLSKIALVYHEMTHCYCGREHDYADGKEYVDAAFKEILIKTLGSSYKSEDSDGFMQEDNCPKSVMHPIILNDYCFGKHYDYYIKEMFNRCVPY